MPVQRGAGPRIVKGGTLGRTPYIPGVKLTAAEFAERVAAMKAGGLQRFPGQFRAAEGRERVIEFVASTEQVASDGMIIKCGAWLTERFLSGGAILVSHNRTEDKLPVGVPIGASVDDSAKCLRVRARLASPGVTKDADDCWALIQDGILRACSVGFRVLEMADPTPSEREAGAWGVVTKAELYELSVVPVGADPGALVVKAGAWESADAEAFERMAATPGLDSVLVRAFGDRATAIRAAAPGAPPTPAPAPKARANRSDACATLRDMVTALRGAADCLAACADELAAEGAPADGEAAQAAAAEATRQAVEAATAPLLTEIRDLKRAAVLGSLTSIVRGTHAA